MEKILQQEVIFSSSDPSVSRKISKLEAEGKIQKIAPRVYTSNLEDSPEIIIRRNLNTILGNLYPGAIVSHRSALEFTPTLAGHFFLTYKYTKKINLGNITLRILKGPRPIERDNSYAPGLYVSQEGRAYLENLQISKRLGPESKTLTLPEIEQRLERIIIARGEDGLNNLRDEARHVAEQLDMWKEYEKLNRLISALLTTHPSSILTSSVAVARAKGTPYDPDRLSLFEELFIALKNREFGVLHDRNTTLQSFKNFAFYEAYFSNYIEGTIFSRADAKKIVETNTPIPNRNEDSHDILGTYHLVSSKQEMEKTPKSPEDLINLLQHRHHVMLRVRQSVNPGQFKERNNQAGETHFVDFKLVRGTLIKGLNYYNTLVHPFARAAYVMFLVSEIHPFVDGNGRVARIMMNAELVKEGQSRIIIPTVFREDYILALRKLTRNREPDAYIRMLERAHHFSVNVFGDNMDEMEQYLESCNAFKEPEGNYAILKVVPRE